MIGSFGEIETRLRELGNEDVHLRSALYCAEQYRMTLAHKWAFVALAMTEVAMELKQRLIEQAKIEKPPIYLLPVEPSPLHGDAPTGGAP